MARLAIPGGPARGGGRNTRTLALLALMVVGMGGLAYASVPLYRLFCQVTGYGGTTQRADAFPGAAGGRTLLVRFDATVNPELDWHFAPAARSMELTTGENALAFYVAENLGSEAVTGTATFNVTPDRAGLYFNKVECFCFTEQVLVPGQRVDMPVSFFIDPEIATDPDLRDLATITLSYTFFRAEDQSGTRLASAPEASGTRAAGNAVEREERNP